MPLSPEALQTVETALEEGRNLVAEGKHAAAEAHYRAAAAALPNAGKLYIALATVLADTGRFRDASNVYFEVLLTGSRNPAILTSLGNLLLGEGRTREAADAFRAAAASDRSYLAALTNRLFALNALDTVVPEEISREHRAVGEQFGASTFSIERPKHDRIRLGYVAAKFYRHTGAQFFEPVLDAHDRSRFHIFCYQNNQENDAVTERLRKSAESWRVIHALDDDAVAAMIAQDEIDVLVDMDGHTRDNRLSLFARRAAPVQVTWLGYPNTTGLSAMDYRITDSIADPAPGADELHTEKLVRLDPVFVPFAALDFAPEVQPLPALKNGFVQFGCFNELHKLSDSAVRMMAEALMRVPGSRLLLKSRSLQDPVICNEQRQRFAQCGVDPARIDSCGGIADRRAYLNLHNHVDIALDTFPYNGTTTTCEALWMGIPVITLQGVTHVQRVSSSLLQAANLRQLVARSPAEYAAMASDLARNLPRLQALRLGMRERLQSSPLMDVEGFTRRLEAAYQDMSAVRDRRA